MAMRLKRSNIIPLTETHRRASLQEMLDTGVKNTTTLLCVGLISKELFCPTFYALVVDNNTYRVFFL